MTTTDEVTTNRLPKPLYAVAGAGELAYRRLRALPEQVEALRERIAPRMRALRAELPGRVEALRAEVPVRMNTLMTEAREVYGDLVAHGEKVVDAARARRHGGHPNGAAITAEPEKAPRKVAKKAVKRPATPAA